MSMTVTFLRFRQAEMIVDVARSEATKQSPSYICRPIPGDSLRSQRPSREPMSEVQVPSVLAAPCQDVVI